jgi:pimeloyl-ACP methyl ester carboxylesterase
VVPNLCGPKNIIMQLHYKIYGAGQPVILIHGFGEDSHVWDKQIDFLKDKYKLIVPDLPGTGASPLLQKESVTMSDYATLIKELLDEEKIEKVTMLGHSMGGYITLAFAEKYPEMLTAFGLLHSGAFADDEEKKTTRRKGIKFIQENGAEAFLKTTTPGLFYDAEKSKAKIEATIQKGKSSSAEALVQYYEAMISRPDRTDVLKSFPNPVLFIIGEHDKAIPFAQSMKQCHLPSVAHIHILRNSAHMGMLEETEKVNEILGEFLQSVKVP